ncbi:MAG: class I SAM-dependent methyltransferase [Verrucomicrobiota bacterium]
MIMHTLTHAPLTPELADLKARQKEIWESGDFGQVARRNEAAAVEFMGRLQLHPGLKVLDVACGTGNLALVAARAGCSTSGIDIATNLIAQAKARAEDEELFTHFEEADAEALPFDDGEFDLVVSMFGSMFAPRPDVAIAEMHRVAKPGGRVAMANWTPEGFIGQMFQIFRKHLPHAPITGPSPMLWGDEATVRSRMKNGFTDLQMTRRKTRLRYPYSPAGTVEFFRRYYGPTKAAFESLNPAAQCALRYDLEEFQTAHNVSWEFDVTEMAAEYLEIVATKE